MKFLFQIFFFFAIIKEKTAIVKIVKFQLSLSCVISFNFIAEMKEIQYVFNFTLIYSSVFIDAKKNDIFVD